MTINVTLTFSGAKTLIRVLDHVIRQTETNVGTMTEVDRLCRKDSGIRWRELRSMINAKLPKKQRIP